LIPYASTTFLGSISNAIKSINIISSTAGDGQQPKPSVARLPSVVEMETHNFTREEIAEKRMYLLNDNGQIDWFLSTTGPLENQYLNMLGAHSSYWYSEGFSRLLCLEVSRRPGKTNTLVNMRPVKNQ
jgi:DDHD domain